MRRVGTFVTVIVAAALLVAPLALGLFSSSAAGAVMMGDFEPFMHRRVIAGYEEDLGTIDRAARASREVLPHAQHAQGVSPAEFEKSYPAVAEFGREWPGLSRDLRDGMLGSMATAIEDLDAIGGVPPIGAMPWAIVGLGVFTAAMAVWSWRGRQSFAPATALLVAGMAIVIGMTAIGAAERADRAESMFGEMAPFMTRGYLTEMQQQFMVVGAAEGSLRNEVIPALEGTARGEEALTQVRAMVELWPHMAGDMAPMIGAMSDNLANFRSISTMPEFSDMVVAFFVVGAALSLAGAVLLVPAARPRKRLAAGVAMLMVVGVGCGTSSGAPNSAPEGKQLVGLFKVDAGSCKGDKASGSYMRMIQPKGGLEEGPFVQNADSACADKTFTLMTPGADGGLLTGEYQGNPDPAFDKSGDSLADGIMKPLSFYAVKYSAAYSKTDPQSGAAVDPPTIAVTGEGELTGSLEGWTVSWNRQHFNQGAPKPDGELPGLTAAPAGILDEQSGRFVLEWSSQVTGGPFDGFTGFWHLEGVFEPR